MRNVFGTIGRVLLLLGTVMVIMLKVFVPTIPLYVLILIVVLFASAVFMAVGYYFEK